MFTSENVALDDGGVLGIPVTHLDHADGHFVEITFYPRILKDQPTRSLTVLIPKQEIVCIVKLKSIEEASALGYNPREKT